MRTCWLLLPALLLGSAVAAAPADDKSRPPAKAPASSGEIADAKAPASSGEIADYRLPPEITDPAAMARMTAVLSALARAVMDMPVGEVQAAAEGRAPTAADKGRTVREVAGGGDPNFERKVQAEIAQSQGAMQAGLKAMVSAMPAIVRAMNEAGAEVGAELGKAVANLPRPDYPRR